MNNRKILEDVYKDFFGTPLQQEPVEVKQEPAEIQISQDKEVPDQDKLNQIDTLFLEEESKELFKKMIKYMEVSSIDKEKIYLPFCITIDIEDKKEVEKITNIFMYYAMKYHYIDSSKIKRLSLYDLEKPEELNSIYQENGMILLENLDALSMNDATFHKKFFHNFLEQINARKITILSGKKEKVKNFLLENSALENYFSFSLKSVSPSVNDVYQEVIEKVSKQNLGEDLQVKILDYVSNTYPKSEQSYSNYIDTLCKYISFYEDTPKLEEAKTKAEVFKELEELVGLKKVKKTFYDLVDLITLKNKTKEELKIKNINLHMVFLGNPGTGKTTVARLIGDILYDLKYIKQNKVVEVSSKDLVAEYVGQTAVKTMNVIEKAMGGILFIDEAYALADKKDKNSYNGEAIATLIKAMEDYRDNLVVIFAGYTKEMQDFLDSNSGIVSRIGYTLEFDDYTNEELKEIFKGMVEKAGFTLEEDALVEVERLINENRNTKNFGNARFIRNVFEKTVICHATNTKNNKRKDILKTITKKDIAI